MIIDERAINAGGITIRKKNSQHKSMIELQRSMKEQIEGIYGRSKPHEHTRYNVTHINSVKETAMKIKDIAI